MKTIHLDIENIKESYEEGFDDVEESVVQESYPDSKEGAMGVLLNTADSKQLPDIKLAKYFPDPEVGGTRSVRTTR